jgi:hypothetical protein
MVADIQLLQGKIIEDLDQYPKNFTKLMEELALEILSEEDLAIASGVQRSAG